MNWKWVTGMLLMVSWSDLCGENFREELREVEALSGLTTAPVVRDAGGAAATGGLKALYFEGLDWKGSPTQVFAWLGLPENVEGKVPGVVLVHGGGGTAFRNWVELWNKRGFAAISIAVEGQTDEKVDRGPKVGSWKRHQWAGPARVGIYGDSGEPLKDQWMYHAVADTILANSLLRSLPEVDADKVGVMGISWGGVITSTVMGIDGRFAFAIPTYGCGSLATAGNQYGRALGENELYRKVWDPMVRLTEARMPALWLSWPGDQHFPLDLQAACYGAMGGDHLACLIPGMRHGHGPGWLRPESYAFAESVVKDGKPWCLQTGWKGRGREVEVDFRSGKPLESAFLISTGDRGFTGARKFTTSVAEVERHGVGWRVSATLPEGTTAWFVNVKSGELTASSDFREVK